MYERERPCVYECENVCVRETACVYECENVYVCV